MTFNTASKKICKFIGKTEKFVSKAYKDPGGVITIGEGFTWESEIFKEYWMKTRGHVLRLGDEMTKPEADKIFIKMIDEEYGAYVNNFLNKQVAQHVYDAMVSVVYNVGPRALKWNWAKAAKAGEYTKSAELLRKTATTQTINGKRTVLNGLVHRRQQEAKILEFGEYSERSRTVDTSNTMVKEVQSGLKELGYYHGKIDGLNGRLTKKAVSDFQAGHPDLVVDGIIGPATRAALERKLSQQDVAKKQTPIASVAAVSVVGAAATTSSLVDSSWVDFMPIAAGVIVVAAAAFILYKFYCYKDEFNVGKNDHAST